MGMGFRFEQDNSNGIQIGYQINATTPVMSPNLNANQSSVGIGRNQTQAIFMCVKYSFFFELLKISQTRKMMLIQR